MGTILGITGAIGSGKSTLANALCGIEPSHARYESGELIAELSEDFNRALSGELAFETTSKPVELVNQALIWFVESISEKLHHEINWNQLAITKHHVMAHSELFEKMFLYVDTVKARPQLLDTRITSDNKEVYRPLLQWLGGYLVAKLSPTIWYDEIMRRINLFDSDKSLVVIGGVRYPSDAACVRSLGGIVIGIERPDLNADTADVTERHREDIKPDIILVNNGTMQELQKTTEQLWFDLGAGRTIQNYNAHP